MSEKHGCDNLCVFFGWGFDVGRYEKQKTDQASAGQCGFDNFSTLIFSSTRGWGTQSLVLNTDRGGCNEFSLANDYRQDVTRSVQSSIHSSCCSCCCCARCCYYLLVAVVVIAVVVVVVVVVLLVLTPTYCTH